MMMSKSRVILVAVLIGVGLSGCGYTTKTSLPEYVQTVHVQNVRNKIDISSEVSSDKPFQTYRPGLEVELRNALIERFVFDGHLKVVGSDKADSLIKMDLLKFDRDPLRYNEDDSIQEFRIHVTASVEFIDLANEKVLWSTGALSGNSDYFTSGRLSKTEDEAVEEALEDLVRHIVERILEEW